MSHITHAHVAANFHDAARDWQETAYVAMESQIQPRAAFMQLLSTSERSLPQIARAFHLRHSVSHAAGLIRAYSMPRERYHDLSALSGLSPMDSTSITAAVSDAVTFATNGHTLRHPTPYTGSAGLSYALWRAGTLLGQQAWQQQAQELAAAALRRSAHLVDASVLDGGCLTDLQAYVQRLVHDINMCWL